VIAAEDEGCQAFFEALDDGFGGASAGLGDLVEEARVGAAGGLGFGDLDADVASVGDLVAKGFEAGFKAGDAHGRGAHVNAAAAGSEIERDAEDADAARGHSLGATLRILGGKG
jgi:hypothetical protein